MNEFNGPRAPRTRVRVAVTLKHPEVGEQRSHTRDISGDGAFILGEGILMPAVGEIVEVQVQDLPGEPAPVVRMRVTRIDKDGMGLQFIDLDPS